MSNIEWTDETWNPVAGCTRASAGCDNCYAVTMTHRLGEMAKADRAAGKKPGKKAHYEGLTVLNARGDRHFNGTVRCIEEALTIPLHWRKPRKVFVNSMSDLFHKDVPVDFIARVWAVMEMCGPSSWGRDEAPRVRDDCHTFQILTKRPERAAEVLNDPEFWEAVNTHGCCDRSAVRPLPHIWLGTSCENQEEADRRIPHLLRCPAAVRFLSCEPLLGAIDLTAFFGGAYVGLPGDKVHPNYNFGIHWVIVGGESGPGARPCNVEWIRSIVRQCKDARVPCFVKQLGAKPREVGCAEPMPMKWVWDDGGENVERWYKPRDHKGAKPDEWSGDLQEVREFPR